MKFKLSFRLLIAFFLVSVFACQRIPAGISSETAATNTADAPVTTVYVVRHGEKDASNPTDKDPDLSDDGRARAEELRTLLKDKPVAALYTTRFKRTMNTLQPLAEERELEIFTYEPTAFESLKNQVLQNHAGKTVVVAGHSNTILSIVETFGVEKPFAEVPESKYDHLFKITIAADKTATLEAGRYGKVTN